MADQELVRVPPGLPDHEMDTNILFEKFTIEEIRNIEKKNRANIERKKEDLRVMVGERYRDLIEAADTISEMKNSSQNVMKSISRMEELCKQLKQNHMAKGSSYHHRSRLECSRNKNENNFYSVASQIKLLLDMPEKMWSAVDKRDNLLATQMYLLSRHINTSLHLESRQAATILSWFPVLSRQWAAISHFKSTILQGCRMLLKEVGASDQQIADALCSILLLEDSTPRQVFAEFLLARTNAVQKLFHPNHQGASIKEQVCIVVQLIINTIHQIHAVFFAAADVSENASNKGSVSSNLLYKILEKITGADQKGVALFDQQGSVSTKHLPESVLVFHPITRAPVSAISVQQLKENCQKWIHACIQSVRSGVGKLLSFVNTVKRLADIREAVWRLLAQETEFETWNLVCKRILTDECLSVWEVFLQPLFVDRVKVLIQYQLETTAELTKKQIIKVVMDLASPAERAMMAEVDLASFTWSECPGDIPANTAWIPSMQKTLPEGGGLLMKAKSFTPVIQSLCKNFDEKLKSLLEDIQPYLLTAEDVLSKVDQYSPFDQLADSRELQVYLQKSSKSCVLLVLEYIKEQMQLWKNSLVETGDKTTNEITMNKILLVGRLCYAMCDLTPHLQQSIWLWIMNTPDKDSNTRSLRFSRSSSKFEEDSIWTSLKAELIQCHMDSYTIWCEFTSSMFIRQFRELHTRVDAVATCTRWDEILIEEETEAGKKINSTIRVPMQASWYVQTLLYAICQEVNRVGGHSLKKQILQELVTKISDGILECYEQFLAENQQQQGSGFLPLTQQKALQLLFDIKYIVSIIPRREETKADKMYQKHWQQVVESLEELVDPFDLDVFSPYIQSHLMKQTQRCSVLLGALTSIDRHALMFVTRQFSSGQQEQHNVLPLTTCPNRFPLLPLSSFASGAALPQPILQALPRGDISSSFTEVAAAVLPKTMEQKGGSFYDKLGSVGAMWFSNIGGKT